MKIVFSVIVKNCVYHPQREMDEKTAKECISSTLGGIIKNSDYGQTNTEIHVEVQR